MTKKMSYVDRLKERPIAIGSLTKSFTNAATDKANEQHYEVASSFFQRCLGPRLKYSCCLYPTGKETLEQAEVAMLESYVEKAGLVDGMDLLDLGCGWGSLGLFLAEVSSLPILTVEIPRVQGDEFIE
jgi:cyclopropane fatty-acyl-phospholipid synthase-like methyltransferase